MDARALLAWNLRKLRRAAGLSQERLAADGGLDRAYVSELERCRKAATVDIMDRLASLLGVPVAALLEMPEASDEPPSNLPRGRRAALRP